MEPKDSSIVIVGAGIVGLACAHYLRRAGFSVTVVERDRIGKACSHGNCGYICPSHVLPLTEPAALKTATKSLFNPQAPFRIKPRLSPRLWHWLLQFARRCNERQMLSAGRALKAILDSSMAEYRSLIKEEGFECEWTPTGLLYVLRTEAGRQSFQETDSFVTDHFNVPARFIPGSDLPDFDPALKPGLAGGYLYEEDAFLRPDRLIDQWTAALKNQGVEFRERTDVLAVSKQGSKIVALQTNEQPIKADTFVFATGAWSVEMEKLLGCRIPIEPGKGYSLTMQRPANCPRHAMLFPEHKVGVTPFENGYRLGSMMEFAGFDTSIPQARIQQLRSSAEPYLHDPHTETIQEEWFGWRPMTWDSLPIIGRTPKLENAFLATGHNMLGLSLAPATGRLVAEQITQSKTHIEKDAFSPNRF